MTTKNAIRYFRLFYKKQVEISFKFPKGWFDEQLQDYDHYDDWFRKNVGDDVIANTHYHGNSIRYYSFYMEANGKTIVRFLQKYSHVVGDIKHLTD